MNRNFSNGNASNFTDKLGKINWEELNQETDPNNAYDHFYNRYTSLFQ